MLDLLANAPARMLFLAMAVACGLVAFFSITSEPFSGWLVPSMAGLIMILAMVAVRRVTRFG